MDFKSHILARPSKWIVVWFVALTTIGHASALKFAVGDLGIMSSDNKRRKKTASQTVDGKWPWEKEGHDFYWRHGSRDERPDTLAGQQQHD